MTRTTDKPANENDARIEHAIKLLETLRGLSPDMASNYGTAIMRDVETIIRELRQGYRIGIGAA